MTTRVVNVRTAPPRLTRLEWIAELVRREEDSMDRCFRKQQVSKGLDYELADREWTEYALRCEALRNLLRSERIRLSLLDVSG